MSIIKYIAWCRLSDSNPDPVITPGSRLELGVPGVLRARSATKPTMQSEVRCRGTMSKHVTANAVEAEAKTLQAIRAPIPNVAPDAATTQIRMVAAGPGGRTGRMQPGRQGGGPKPGLHLCFSLLVFIFLARLNHSSKLHR
jgi:hypothetical protein